MRFTNPGVFFLAIASSMSLLAGCTESSSRSTKVASQEKKASAPPASAPSNQVSVPNTERDWEEQLSALQAGDLQKIEVTSRPVGISQLQQLQSLSLPESNTLLELIIDAGVIDDVGLATIVEAAPQLEHLRLRYSPITNAGLESLAKLSNLRILNIPQAEFDASGLAHLTSLEELTQIRLGGKQFDDDAVQVLATFPKLQSLHLIGPSLSEAGLDHLAKAPKLSSFYLDECELPDRAWQKLFAANPQLHVHIDQHHHDRDPSPDKH